MSHPHILGVIPARYASSRFPGKPLVDIRGKSMIQRVYEQASQSTRLAAVVVATDDARIAEEVSRFGGRVEMTNSQHRSGTERLTEVAPRFPEATHLINIQGDEPLLHAESLDRLAELLTQPATELATLAMAIQELSLLHNPNVVKVVLGEQGQALYFSRQAIPYCRDVAEPTTWLQHTVYYKHIGLYGYRRDVLLRYPQLTPSPLELAESLEQLRWLAHGYDMRVALTDQEAIAIDTPEDLARLLDRWPEAE
jgi:3-deoxy-manno-octulosonate cytidylyltransferase (CMP-KDO synthetase)